MPGTLGGRAGGDLATKKKELFSSSKKIPLKMWPLSSRGCFAASLTNDGSLQDINNNDKMILIIKINVTVKNLYNEKKMKSFTLLDVC